MKRLTATLGLLLLVACAPVQDFNAATLNQVTSALGVLTANSEGVTITPVQPLGHTVLVISGRDVKASGYNCNATGKTITCEWPSITEPQTVIINGQNVSVTTSYRVQGKPGVRHEVLR